MASGRRITTSKNRNATGYTPRRDKFIVDIQRSVSSSTWLTTHENTWSCHSSTS